MHGARHTCFISIYTLLIVWNTRHFSMDVVALHFACEYLLFLCLYQCRATQQPHGVVVEMFLLLRAHMTHAILPKMRASNERAVRAHMRTNK